MTELNTELFDLTMSEKAKPLFERVKKHLQENVAPWQEEFEAAYAGNGYFGLTMHPQFIGRPARLHMLDEFISWIETHEGVWITTCRAVAEQVVATR